jgi:hypothetical protein
MGYSGFTELLCLNGHYSGHDAYDDTPPACRCGAAFRYSHGVDQTNGYDESHESTCRAPKVQIGTEDEWHMDPYLNRYAKVVPLFAPSGDGIWIRINSKGQATPPYPDDLASRIEARSDATGTGAAEGESLTRKAGDAQ